MTALPRLAILGLCLPALFGASPAGRVVIKGRGVALGETPIVVALTVPIEPGPYTLSRERSAPIDAMVFREGGTTYLSTTLDGIPAGGDTVFSLERATGERPRVGRGVELAQKAGSVDIRLEGTPFTTLDSTTGPKPYFFPLNGPNGKPFTRSFPMRDIPGEKRDHPHQRSMWFTHGKVNGIDFWSEQKGHGRIVEKSRQAQDHDTVGTIRTTDDWVGPDGKIVLSDVRVVRVFQTKGARILDFDITLKADHGAVTFGDTKEGMFGVRVASSMDVDAKTGGKITNSDGLTDAAAWGKAAAWVDYTGPVEGETVGIAILNHPDSFRYPTTWHVRTYGLFAANPFGWHDFGMKKSGDYTIPAGESIRFGYRAILHKGDTASAGLPAAFEAYARPPVVEVIKGE
jgi:hypothetical protein